MNKKAARTKALSGDVSIKYLREIIKERRTKNIEGYSAVNKNLPMYIVLEIYERAISDRADEERPNPYRYDCYKDREVVSKDVLLMTNILRDCA